MVFEMNDAFFIAVLYAIVGWMVFLFTDHQSDTRRGVFWIIYLVRWLIVNCIAAVRGQI
jgi:hypothetical protein